MSTTIPYDPALALGNIVPQKLMSVLQEIAAAQAPIAAAQEGLNSAQRYCRSLEMTMQELANMDIDTASLDVKFKDAKHQVLEAATTLVNEQVNNAQKVTTLRSRLPAIHQSIESPLDFTRTQFKEFPLSAYSLTLDSQYFDFQQESQGSSSVMSAIKSFVSESTEIFGDSASSQATAAAQRQVSRQRQHHDISGTLIITATATLRDGLLLSPMILDVDKAIRVWNAEFPDDTLNPESVESMTETLAKQDKPGDNSLQIISGVTYGCSFVGMVHLLKQSETQDNQSMLSTAAGLQDVFKVGLFIGEEEGGFGVDSSFAESAKNLLSTSTVQAHCSIVCMGAIPTIKANLVKQTVKEFANFNPQKQMEELGSLQAYTNTAQESLNSSAEKARAGGQMLALRSGTVKACVSATKEADTQSNEVLNINSMMTAFTNFVDQLVHHEGHPGVPVNYYIDPITKSELAHLWVRKYYPQYLPKAHETQTKAGSASK